MSVKSVPLIENWLFSHSSADDKFFEWLNNAIDWFYLIKKFCSWR
jgi:hypothetical protein